MDMDMEKIITSQLSTNAMKSLFWDQNFLGNSQMSFRCSDYTIDTLLNSKKSVLSFIDALEQNQLEKKFAEQMSELIIDTLEEINQFLIFDETGRAAMAQVYSEFLSNIKRLCQRDAIDADMITTLFRAHYINIKNSLVSTNGTKVFEEYTANPRISKKVCSEYTAQFQLEILHIDVSKLIEPVLDLGCGKSGALVMHLLELGIDAYGTDRSAKEHEKLSKKDWFNFELAPDSWGTVISHMAFSNHFLFAEDHGRSGIYESKYQQILQSLKSNGEFIYAPGLSKIEASLEQSGGYSINRFSIGNEKKLYSAKIKKLY